MPAALTISAREVECWLLTMERMRDVKKPRSQRMRRKEKSGQPSIDRGQTVGKCCMRHSVIEWHSGPIAQIQSQIEYEATEDSKTRKQCRRCSCSVLEQQQTSSQGGSPQAVLHEGKTTSQPSSNDLKLDTKHQHKTDRENRSRKQKLTLKKHAQGAEQRQKERIRSRQCSSKHAKL